MLIIGVGFFFELITVKLGAEYMKIYYTIFLLNIYEKFMKFSIVSPPIFISRIVNVYIPPSKYFI